MAWVVLLFAVLTCLVQCQPQFQQFSSQGRQQQFLQFSPQGRHQLFSLQNSQQQLSHLLQGRHIKFGERTDHARSLCTDSTNCKFGYTFNVAELETDNGESVNTQFSVAALDGLPPLPNRSSSPRIDSGSRQNVQPPPERRRSELPQNSLSAFPSIRSGPPQPAQTPSSPRRFEPPQNILPAFPFIRSGPPQQAQTPSTSRRVEPPQNILSTFPFIQSVFPQFNLPSPPFDLPSPQFDPKSQPEVSLNSVLQNPVRKNRPTLRTTPTTTTTKTTTITNINEYEDSTDNYYYDYYEESFTLQDDDVREQTADDFSPVSNEDYEYDYMSKTCPGSLEECINVCIPQKDIYVYSICVMECGDRCN